MLVSVNISVGSESGGTGRRRIGMKGWRDGEGEGGKLRGKGWDGELGGGWRIGVGSEKAGQFGFYYDFECG